MTGERGFFDNVVPFEAPEAADAAADAALKALGLADAALPTRDEIAERTAAQKAATEAMTELLKETGFAFVITSIPRQADYEKLRALAESIRAALKDFGAETGIEIKKLFPVSVEIVIDQEGNNTLFTDMPPRGITLHVGLNSAQNDILESIRRHQVTSALSAANDAG